MSRYKGIYLIVILLSIMVQQGYSQVSQISGVINAYTPIETIYSFDDNNVDSLIVADVTDFGVGDTVMVYLVQGATVKSSLPYSDNEFGEVVQDAKRTGKYAFLIIDEIDVPLRLVVLNSTVRDDIRPMANGDVAQLIRVPSYRNAAVKAGGVMANEWDGTTGGVVAMFVHGVLELNGDIDVTGKGFRGASEDQDYSGICSVADPGLYDDYFYAINDIKAGKKGEGTTDTSFSLLRGRASSINGGGGGNALFSGGGGGSNFNSGGKGGNESTACAPGVSLLGGGGGFDLSRSYYTNDNTFNQANRIFFGGGGGSGTRIPGRTTTDGADGGGLVVIIADTIVGNGNWIFADGNDVTGNATGAAGGGGGGGGIILDVSGYKTALNLSAVGGKGGDTNHPSDTTGPGGGGGGGIYWMAGPDQPGVNPRLFINGITGKYTASLPPTSHGATDGGVPGNMDNLITPIRGFLFNSVPSEFTVCSDWDPDPILASVPKGGSGPGTYSYQWVDSSSTQNFWDIAPGASTNQNYDPGPLSDTTYFRRIVTSGILPADTSFRIVVYVHPAITNNTVSAPDTVCWGDQPQLFFSSATIGGGPTGGSYTYKWQKNEGSGYTDADGPNPIDGSGYQSPGLTVTTDFARIAYAGVCFDTSALLTVKVLEPLTNFEITPNDTVCYNTVLPDLINSLTGSPPTDGDQGDIRYQWITSANTISWSDVGGETSQSFQPPALTQTTYYRRVVLSGSDNACIDTSDYVEILNIPDIANNTISETQTVCTGDLPELLFGSDPTGGVPGQYKYLWRSRTAATGWVPATGINNVKTNYDPGVMNGDTTYFQRIVGSGGVNMDVCQHSEMEVAINVLPPISNNTIQVADGMKCQGDPVDQLVGALPTGGDGVYIYKWEVAAGQDNPDSWATIGSDEISITDPASLDSEHDRWYKRIVFSGPNQVCDDTTDLLQIIVHTTITGNNIEPADSVCFADSKLLLGDTPAGEAGLTPVYTWKDLDNVIDLPGSDEDFTTVPYNALGNYNYKREVQIGECTNLSETMVISVMQLPGGILTDAAFKACEQEIELAIDLNIEGLQTYVLPWEVTLKNGVEGGIGPVLITADGDLPVTLDIDTDSLQLLYELESITYHSTGGRYSCTAPAGNMSGIVPIHVFRKPEPQILVDGVARDSFKVCNTTVDLVASADNGEATWTTNPSGRVFFSPGAGQEEFLASIPNNPDAFGKYTLTYTSEAGDCAGEDIIDLHYFEQPANAFAGADTVIFLINTIQLKADPPTAGIGTWELISGAGIIEDENAPNTLVNELALGEENTFNWTVRNGEDEGECTTSNDVTIVLRSDVRRYDGFSPDNGDMINEYFIMQGLGYSDEFSISFFNALGKTVKTTTHENVDEMDVDLSLISGGLREDEIVVWDGDNDNGKPVPSGTYYYVVNFVQYGISYDFKGYVVVARD